MTYKNAKTVLFASLIVAMILPFGSMQSAEAKQDVNDMGKLTAYEEWVLKTLLEQSDIEKAQSIEKLRSFVDTLGGYEKFIFDHIVDIAEAEKQLELATEQNKSEQTIQELEIKRITLYFELEEYGVTTKDRFDANPEYWKTRVINAKIEMETPQTNNVGVDDENTNLYYVHQSDLALKRTSIMTIPLFGYGPATIPFPVISYGWNQGTSTSSWGFIVNPTGGTVTYESLVCLDSATHHDSVDFDMTSTGNTKNVFGQIQYNYDETSEVTHSDVNDCESFTKTIQIPSTYSATLSTTISDISLN